MPTHTNSADTRSINIRAICKHRSVPGTRARSALFVLITTFACPLPATAQPVGTTDLADFAPSDGLYRRVLGSVGQGAWGVPLGAGFDMDKDGINDAAFAAMRASPLVRNNAGEVFLVFGDNTVAGGIDTAGNDPRVLRILGDQEQENAGSEVWMADVTGDGYGELIICRQNYSPDGRIGAGALTLISASPVLRTMAMNGTALDLRSPPGNVPIVTIYGAMATSRFCIWPRNGDVTGDGIDDLLVGADREMSDGVSDAGAVYLFRGGDYLETTHTIDLQDLATASPRNVARVRPRALADDADETNTEDYHFGATVYLADLDGNGKADVLAAAALNRAGAALGPAGGSGNGTGGTAQGTLFIAWDDNFGGDWLPAPDFVIDAGPGDYTIIDGAAANEEFGEELLGGLDYDDDDAPDLFVGDLTANGWGGVSRSNAGLAHVIYDAGSLKGLEFDLEPDAMGEAGPPVGFAMATFVGPVSGAIAADTALHGDFNGDGIADLAFASPHDNPAGRNNAGTLHIVLGKSGRWPALSDLDVDNYPAPEDVQIHEIYGAKVADVLCYSGAAGDVSGDGITDIIINEMLGDGSSAQDVGNLLLIDSKILFRGQTILSDSFEN
jgi:hypothetical protein